MDGGHGEQPPESAMPAGEADASGYLARLLAQQHARDAADTEALAEVPFLANAVTRLASAVSDLLEVRYQALGAHQVAAAVRVLHREQARLGAARLRSIKAVDDRDDVVPDARPGTAGAAFLRTGLGLERGPASLDVDGARLLDRDTGDLPQVGAAYAAGDISRAHVDMCVRVHRRLDTAVRNALTPVVDPRTGDQRELRCIEVVDATLAGPARVLSVAEFKAVADRLLQHLDPPTPRGAHARRYLNLTQLPDGSLIGRFACGPAQALALTTVIAAGATPQTGTAVDEHGVHHQLQDERTPGQRRMDALVDAVRVAAAAPALTAPRVRVPRTPPVSRPRNRSSPASRGTPGTARSRSRSRRASTRCARCRGCAAARTPTVEIIVTATLEQLAGARLLARHATVPEESPPGSPPGPAGALLKVEGFARAQHGGPVHPQTLALLVCSAWLRRVLLDPHGAVLDLGRRQRLASSARKRALLARDGGCVIPGCLVPGEDCDVHHPTPWAAGGRTDMADLALLCPRHHTEVHEVGSWTIEMIDGMPWVRPPAWAHPTRALLRNTAHRPHDTSA